MAISFEAPFPAEAFADVLAANRDFTERFTSSGRTGRAAKGLAIVTCIDSRVLPLEAVGMSIGDAKILRNAGARVTQDVLRTLALATYLLNVDRILIMPHTDCRMAKGSEEAVHQEIFDRFGVNTWSMQFDTTTDQLGALRTDVARVRSFPFLRKGVEVAGAIYNVESGQIVPQDI
ncbi:MAG: carbonic anhydrase [Actinobacteria bacterium]|nr:carbonic anhydrase [Actinomycetota bacterium]MCB9412748.1 carbonic anhydrase [Actinomycetota bacterium]